MYNNKVFMKYANKYLTYAADYKEADKIYQLSKQNYERNLQLVQNSTYGIFTTVTQQQLMTQFLPGTLYGFTQNTRDTILYTLKNTEQELIAVKSMYVPLSLDYNNTDHIKQYQNINEAVITMLIDQKVNNKLLHFPLYYGFKSSGPTFIAKDNNTYKVAITPHDNNTIIHNTQYYLYTEYFRAKPLSKYIKSLTLPLFLQIWYQICYALYYMQYYYNFTHYDLHANNIMLENLQQPIVLSYVIGNKTYTVKSNILVRIIDMGSSYIKVDGVAYGINDHNTITIGRQKQFNKFHDIYLLLIIILSYYISNEPAKLNKEIGQAAQYFFTFFNNTESFNEIVPVQLQFNFAYFPIARESEQTLLDFINHCMLLYPLYTENTTISSHCFDSIRYHNLTSIQNTTIQNTLSYYLTLLSHYDFTVCGNIEYNYTLLTFCHYYYQLAHHNDITEEDKVLLLNLKKRFINKSSVNKGKLVNRQLTILYNYTFLD